jgi:23S rRNA G2069 N7-methylase RlmK/C1962 C5-methylase RlmI
MSYIEDKTSLQADMLANRLQKRFRHLKKWAQRTGSGAFRLY